MWVVVGAGERLATAWTLRPEVHPYHAIIGGFLGGEVPPAVSGKQLALRHHRVDGSIAYEYAYSRFE